MCGIFGFISNIDNKISKHHLDIATKELFLRGPDNFGFFEENINENYIYFGHQRLSVIDLKSNSNQPMFSNDKRYVIIFNGEIYNHIELREHLKKNYNVYFKTSSDTETLLILLLNEGIENALKKIDGMFAFSFLDRKTNKIYLCRDRIGEKPLYIHFNKNYFTFSSDIKSFKNLPKYNREINNEAIQNFFYLNYIPCPYSIYKSTFKLPQGSYLYIDLNNFEYFEYKNFNEIKSKNLKINSYWTINDNKFYDKPGNISEKVESLLTKSVEQKLISDVPICSFLSGGTDSSLIAAILSKITKKIDTFTVSYDDHEYNESIYAKEISNILGLKNHKINISKKEIINTIPILTEIYSEPFSDSSQIPTFLICKKIKEHATVAIGGDGGDELFGGYNRYLYYNRYKNYINFTPKSLKRLFIKMCNTEKMKFLINPLLNLLINEETLNKDQRNYKIIQKLKQLTDNKSFYESMINQNLPYNFFHSNINNLEKSNIMIDFDDYNNNFEQQMMNNDLKYYLPDDILCKVDRASMYSSLEVRSPFLSKDLIEYSQKIPINFKINNGISKYIIKKILEKYLPNNLIYRPKHGFAVPIKKMIKNELKDWTNDLLSKKIIEKFDILNYPVVKKIFEDHTDNKNNNEHILWSIIQLNQWLLNESK